MKKVLIYAGTTEGRMLAEQLAAEHIPCHVCVATAYGQLVMPKMDGVEVTTGRLDIARMRQLASEMTAENEKHHKNSTYKRRYHAQPLCLVCFLLKHKI